MRGGNKRRGWSEKMGKREIEMMRSKGNGWVAEEREGDWGVGGSVEAEKTKEKERQNFRNDDRYIYILRNE